MKCVLLMDVIVVLVVIIVVSANPSCRLEKDEYMFKNSACWDLSSQIQQYVVDISKGILTYEELSTIIENDCNRLNITSCYSDVSIPIAGSCNNDESIQNIRNTFKLFLLFNEYFCQNNGQKYLDLVKDGGANCYYFNKGRSRQCVKDAIKAVNVTTPIVKAENLCIILDSELLCMYHYENYCTNPNVGEFAREFIVWAREKLCFDATF